MNRALSLAALLFAAGCASTSVSYHPRSAIPAPAVTSRALMAYEDDVQTIAEAGGKVLGELRGGGNEFADREDLQAKACEEAARRGGTHVLILKEGYAERVRTVAGSATVDTTMNRQGTAARTDVRYTPPQDYVVSLPVGSFLVVRVPKENWATLPEGLRPVANYEGNWWEAPRGAEASR